MGGAAGRRVDLLRWIAGSCVLSFCELLFRTLDAASVSQVHDLDKARACESGCTAIRDDHGAMSVL